MNNRIDHLRKSIYDNLNMKVFKFTDAFTATDDSFMNMKGIFIPLESEGFYIDIVSEMMMSTYSLTITFEAKHGKCDTLVLETPIYKYKAVNIEEISKSVIDILSLVKKKRTFSHIINFIKEEDNASCFLNKKFLKNIK